MVGCLCTVGCSELVDMFNWLPFRAHAYLSLTFLSWVEIWTLDLELPGLVICNGFLVWIMTIFFTCWHLEPPRGLFAFGSRSNFRRDCQEVNKNADLNSLIQRSIRANEYGALYWSLCVVLLNCVTCVYVRQCFQAREECLDYMFDN